MLERTIECKEERRNLITSIVTEFNERTFLRYRLPNESYLILTKDERKIKSLRRYEGSPMPLLTNLESFSSSVGD